MKGKKVTGREKEHRYPSDISREQFELIREDLENMKKKTRPRQTDLYDVFCAIVYIIKTGSQWRAMPSDYPQWKLVYYYFKVWSRESEDEKGNKSSALSRALKKVCGNVEEEGWPRREHNYGNS